MIKKWIQTLLPFDFLAQRLQMTLCDCPKLPVNEKRKKKKSLERLIRFFALSLTFTTWLLSQGKPKHRFSCPRWVLEMTDVFIMKMTTLPAEIEMKSANMPSVPPPAASQNSLWDYIQSIKLNEIHQSATSPIYDFFFFFQRLWLLFVGLADLGCFRI